MRTAARKTRVFFFPLVESARGAKNYSGGSGHTLDARLVHRRTRAYGMTLAMTYPLLLSSSLLGAGIAAAYVLVLGNFTGDFAVPASAEHANATGLTRYMTSPYWFRVPVPTVSAIVALQLLAAIGYVVWFVWLLMGRPAATALPADHPGTLLDGRVAPTLLLHGFLVASVAWPFAAYWHQLEPASVGRALAACLPLWVSAACVIGLIGGTFEAWAPPAPTLGILLLGLVVVLCDGVGWSALCLKHTLALATA